MVWQAYRAPTPKACFDLLGRDLTALPLLKSALLELLEEPSFRHDGARRDGNAALGVGCTWIYIHE